MAPYVSKTGISLKWLVGLNSKSRTNIAANEHGPYLPGLHIPHVQGGTAQMCLKAGGMAAQLYG